MNKVYIYTLTDPRTGQVHYIGKTVNPDRRKYYMLRGWDYGEKIRSWIRELYASGTQPVFAVIEECDKRDGGKREEYWINIYNKGGLLNTLGVTKKYGDTSL